MYTIVQKFEVGKILSPMLNKAAHLIKNTV